MKRIEYNPNENMVEYELGDSGRTISFDAGDLYLPQRLEEMFDNLEAFGKDFCKKNGIKDMADVSKVKSENPVEDLKQIREVEEFVRNEIDKAFNSNVSENAFGKACCCSLTNGGETYYNNFLRHATKAVEAEFNVRIKKVTNSKTNKYMSQKGKHSK